MSTKEMNSMKKVPVFSALTFCVVFLFSILCPNKGLANIYNVTNTTDGNGLNQLRGAILAADALGGTHTINVSAGTYLLTLGEITFGNNAENITIIGAGPASTIISMTTGAGKDRIFFINPTGTTNSPVISVQGIKFQNGYLSSDLFGGAAICAGGGSGESLTITNCAFDNNVLPVNAYGGAAVCMQVRGNLTIDNSTFTNNVSNDADGGAVLFIIFGSALGTGFGALNVTNSTFTGNSVNIPGATTSNGGALAFTGQGGVTPFTVSITKNTFISNTADGLGGAISANNSPNVSIPQIHYNRFYNNSSAVSELSSGLHFVESSGSVNAENNWWGCNTSPVGGTSTAPCNQAGGDVPGLGSLDANPWLELKITASPGTICSTAPTNLGNTSTVTASFLNNSDGTAISAANLSGLIGAPVTWPAPTLGSYSSQQTTIQASGTATAVFTSNGTAGTATVRTQVDYASINTSVLINTAPIVAPQPMSQSVCSGANVTLTSSATGNPTPTVQWQVSTNGGMSFSNIMGATNTTLMLTAAVADNGKQYRAVFTNTCATINSNPAILTVFPIENPAFAYTRTAYCQLGADPAPVIYGTPGGIFSAPAQISINPSSGVVDVSASTVGGPYTITYNTNGPCPQSATFALSIVACQPGATLTDALIIDNGTIGKADPGDRIRLTAKITNGQTADYDGVQLVLNNDPRVTFVPNSFKSTPVAVDDAYTAAMNTLLTVVQSSGVLINDFDDGILSVTAFSATSAQGGTVSVNANGSFTYNPPGSFTGNDTFTYTITDSDMQTNTGTVRIRVQ